MVLQACVTGFCPKLKSFWSCSHMNCCLQNILYINLHILYIIQVKTSSKIQKLQVFPRKQQHSRESLSIPPVC